MQAIAIAFMLGVLGIGSVGGAWAVGWRLCPEDQRREAVRWLTRWSLKGLMVPLVLWALMNWGLSWELQPFMPEIQAAQYNGQNWYPSYLQVLGTGWFVLSSYWASMTAAWAIVRALRHAPEAVRAAFRPVVFSCLLGMAVPGAIVVLIGGWAAVGLAVLGMLAPVAACAPAVLYAPKARPIYSPAVAKIKFGKYSEAEWEIIRQLEKCEDDFQGWMMLADLYATRFNDLAHAEQTALELCDHPTTTPSQLSVVLHRLADWHLKIGRDPRAARDALRMIVDRLPGTHLAHMAELRIAQLPKSVAGLRAAENPRAIPLPALGDQLDERPQTAESERGHEQAVIEANECVQALKQDANDIGARERFARLLAEKLGQPAAGLEQINLLLGMPGQAERKYAEWLSVGAAWHIRFMGDPDTGRQWLERLIREFPETVQAYAARRRITMLEQRKPAG
jgi:hypothetical protein